jgi:hypothetical protein
VRPLRTGRGDREEPGATVPAVDFQLGCGRRTSGIRVIVSVMADAPWEPPLAGSEETQLIAALERLRTTFRWKADGLGAAGLGLGIATSSLTLGALLKHLALVEDYQFSVKYDGTPLGAPWPEIDWNADPDWEFRAAADDAPETLYALWDDAVERSRRPWRRTAALISAWRSAGMGKHASLRRLLTDFIEEYGRHAGHADLLREAVDGLTGEDPPAEWRPKSGHYRLPGTAG